MPARFLPVLALAVVFVPSAFAATARYTSASDPVQLVDPGIVYNGETLTVEAAPPPAPGQPYVQVALPGGLDGLAAGDLSFEMRFTSGQTPASETPPVIVGPQCGIELWFDDGGTGKRYALYWSDSMFSGGYSVSAIVDGGIPSASFNLASDLRALRLVRTGDTLTLQYDLAGGTTDLTSFDLAADAVNTLPVTCYVHAINGMGVSTETFDVDEILAYGPNVPEVNPAAPPVGGAIRCNKSPGFVEEGMHIILTAPEGSSYSWTKDGAPVVGASGRELHLDPVSTLDQGVYRAAYDDGSKVLWESQPYYLEVQAEGSLPLAGPLGLAALAALLAAAGWRRSRG